MRVLAILAHPSGASFDAALFRQSVATLREGGHEVRTLDLYGEAFEARLSEPEWRMNGTVPENRAPVAGLVDDLLWADALVFVFPTWWSGMPAILKGWLDRVFLPGVVFELKDGPVRPLLTQIKVWAVITTCGSAWWQVLGLLDPVRVLMRALRVAVAPQAKPVFLRLYKMDTTTPEERARFLAKVTGRLKAL